MVLSLVFYGLINGSLSYQSQDVRLPALRLGIPQTGPAAHAAVEPIIRSRCAFPVKESRTLEFVRISWRPDTAIAACLLLTPRRACAVVAT